MSTGNSTARSGSIFMERYYDKYKASRKYPLSIHAFTKSDEYRDSLVEDIHKFYKDEILSVHGSPSWVCEFNKEISHSGESPLFLYRLLSPSKSVRNEEIKSNVIESNDEKRSYYRPNSTHQYLSNTELKDQCVGEVNLKYGRPTRTTLLRARQRGNSTPVNAYEQRRKQKQKENKELKTRIAFQSQTEPRLSYHGESNHSFVTGARYNGAHVLDTRSLSIYGVYVPRHEPERYFVNGRHHQDIHKSSPSAPPDSPRSVISTSSSLRCRPKTAPNYRRSEIPAPRKAWENNSSPNCTPRRENMSTTPHSGHSNSKERSTGNTTSYESLLPSVKGMSFSHVHKTYRQLSNSDTRSSPMSPEHSNRHADTVDLQNNKNIVIANTKYSSPLLVDKSVDVASLDNEENNLGENKLKVVENIRDEDREGAYKTDTCETTETIRDDKLITEDFLCSDKEDSITSPHVPSQVITIPSEGDA